MTFADLHRGPRPLLLPNAWDVASALAFAEAGFPAVGTTSFGVSAAIGRPDAGRTSRQATADLVRRLRALPAYVTADLEDGYSDDPAEVADLVAALADVGLAGVNVEDSTYGQLIDPAAHAAKVTAIRTAAPGVFVNARVETYWSRPRPTRPCSNVSRPRSRYRSTSSRFPVSRWTGWATSASGGSAPDRCPTAPRSTLPSPPRQRSGTAARHRRRRPTRRRRRDSNGTRSRWRTGLEHPEPVGQDASGTPARDGGIAGEAARRRPRPRDVAPREGARHGPADRR